MEAISCIQRTSQISHIYPDTSEELCDKHSKLLSKLKHTFATIYDESQPDAFVIVNGIAKVLQLGENMEVNFAIENGITILYAKTYPNSEIFINGNQHFQEIVFSEGGKHVEGLHERIHEIKQIIRHCLISKSNKEHYGGIIYIYSNIGDKLFNYRQCLTLALLIALLSLQDELIHYSQQDLLNTLSSIDPDLSLKHIHNLLNNYQLGKCNIENKANINEQISEAAQVLPCNSSKSINTLESNQSIKSHCQKGLLIAPEQPQSNDSISSFEEHPDEHLLTAKGKETCLNRIKITQCKLILCQLDVSPQELQAYHSKHLQLTAINSTSRQIDNGRQNLFEEGEQENHSHKSLGKNMQQAKLAEYVYQNKSLVERLSEQKIQFSEYIRRKHSLDMKYSIYEEGLAELLLIVSKEAPFLQNLCVIEGTVLLISVQTFRYAETMSFLRKLFNNNVLSTNKYLQSNRRCEPSGYGRQIGEILFTSLPSVGCALFKADPQNFQI